jgi:RNA polymerase sigma-70 factor (ECF subfamily)
VNALDPHFFRHEWARLVAVLVRVFGTSNLALAEDVAQDALFRAMQAWPIEGTPESPSAWLTAVAKRRAIDELRKARTHALAAPELARMLDSEWTRSGTVDELFAPKPLRDDELRMMFWLAQPRLPEASQVALVLQLCSGFGETEIAAAFLTTPAAIAKRLQRAKAVVMKSAAPRELGEAELGARLDVVHRAIYLLFNEGYHGACSEAVLRTDLCREALRLVLLLVDHPATRTGPTLALAALLHLHAARLPSRLDENGELLPLSEQRRDSWDAQLVARGLELLDRSSQGDACAFHLEAAIAACHATARSFDETPWASIVRLYDALSALAPSPVVALSRAIAIAQLHGPERGLVELAALDCEELRGYVFYHAALADLSARVSDTTAARAHYERAVALARNPSERTFLERRARLMTQRNRPYYPS